MALTACFWVHKEGACSEFQWKGEENTVKKRKVPERRGRVSFSSDSELIGNLPVSPPRYMIIIAT